MGTAAQPALTWPARLSRGLELAWSKGAASRPPLDADLIIAAAIRREGTKPSDGPWRERLDWLCASLRDEAKLNSLGRTIAYGQLVRIVASRGRAERLWDRHPEILERPIRRPIAIVGQMRSGTTRIHRLLACDPGLSHTRLFETLEPVPHFNGRRLFDRRPISALAGTTLLKRCNPALSQIHPTSPYAPEEEFGLHAFSLWGAQFEGQWYVPTFASRCEASDPTDVYEEFARLLKTIAWHRRDSPIRPHLIKAPQFCQDLGALVRQFPDLSVFRLKRRAEEIVASGASLAWHQARIQSDHADRVTIGAEWLRKSALRELRLAEGLAANPGISRLDLDYDEVSADWRGVMSRAYRFVDRQMSPSVERAMAHVAERSSAHLGHRYTLEDFGLSPNSVAAAFA